MAAAKPLGVSPGTAMKNAEKIALAKMPKQTVPKEVAPKAPSINKSGKAAGNFGVGGTL